MDIIVHTIVSENRGVDPQSLHEKISSDYHPQIAVIVELNGNRRKPPTGKAGSALSRLLLTICNDLGIQLSPVTRARLEGHSVYCPEPFY